MQIITGRFRGRIIKMPSGIRPTENKVRKAVFDILSDINGLSFLELFAGSGAVGLEALSQGAKEAVFVENNSKCIRVIKDNLSALGCLKFRVIGQEATRAIEGFYKHKQSFDIIFLDPPYYKDGLKKALQILSAYDILTPNGYIIAQHFKKENLPEAMGDLILFKQARYGDTALSFYKMKDNRV